MRDLVIGRGEVGTALSEVLGCTAWDITDGAPLPTECDNLHISFPYSGRFITDVAGYTTRLNPAVVIIHSTVPVGTSRKCYAAHSPIHGKHPNLVEGIRTFVKYVGAHNDVLRDLACKSLLRHGITVQCVSSPEASELSKLLCTAQYGHNIIVAKEIRKACERYNVPFDEVYGWNQHYNAGYTKLGMPHVCRSVLKPVDGPIGGHCVTNNAKLLDSWLTETLLERNATY
jgi:UDP-N-acetyl-D-mannosaminuronate dehydrogenase